MRRKSKIATVIFLLLGTSGALACYQGMQRRSRVQTAGEAPDGQSAAALVDLRGEPATIHISPDGVRSLGIETVEVKPAPPPQPLRLTGSLLLDPARLVRIHARFPGELISLGMVPVDSLHDGDSVHDGDSAQELRAIRYGDKVVKNQLLAIVWSKDIGEKKSELVEAISKRDIDRRILEQYEAAPDVISGRTIYEAKRNYQGDEVAVARAERTLRSWRLTEDELQEIHQEAKRIQERKVNDPRGDRTWAETDMRSPIDGVIIEKNFNVGDIVDPTQDLFKVADLSRLQVQANALEEDLPALRALPPEQRRWRIDVKADPNDVPMPGKFDVGNIIDPGQHAGTVMGWIDNPNGRFSVGAFVTVVIDLPPDPGLVLVPTSALIEQGGCAKVFVEIQGSQSEFVGRNVLVVDRGRESTYVRAAPRSDQCAGGAERLTAGERVIKTGAAELAAKLAGLSAAPREP